MSMLSTIGMNTSRAHESSHIAAANARSVSATLRALTSTGAVVSPSGALMCFRTCRVGRVIDIRSSLHREAAACLQRPVDGDGGLRAFGGGHHDELDVAGRIADDIEAGDARLAEMVRFDHAFVCDITAKLARQIALRALGGGEENPLARYHFAAGEDDL